MSQLVQQNEADATLRRLYFYLVDATDGITPETGEAGGQPEISVDGGQFTTTGVGTLVLQDSATPGSSGLYYAVVTQGTVNVASGIISGRYKSAATAEAPSLNQLQVVEWDPQVTPKTVNDRVGAFSATGNNTLFGFLKALFRKGLTAPSDIGGSYDPATDSVEAIRDRMDAMAGAGFSTTAHSLVEIAEGHVAAVGGSGGGAGVSPSSTGWIGRVIAKIRRVTDEPDTNSKYTNAVLIHEMRTHWVTLWTDLKLDADSPAIVRYDVAITADVQEYFLPAPLGEIMKFSKIVTETGLPEWELFPQSFYNPWGPGFRIEGNILRVTPVWKEGHTLRMEYVPSGDVAFHEGTGDLQNGTTFEFDLDPAPTTTSTTRVGDIDGRENAYAGMVLRILVGGVANRLIERMITTYNADTGIATISPSLDGVLATGPQSYEVIPHFGTDLEYVLGLSVARSIAMSEGNSKRYNAMTQDYAEARRALRMRFRDRESRRASHATGDVSGNSRFSQSLSSAVR